MITISRARQKRELETTTHVTSELQSEPFFLNSQIAFCFDALSLLPVFLRAEKKHTLKHTEKEKITRHI